MVMLIKFVETTIGAEEESHREREETAGKNLVPDYHPHVLALFVLFVGHGVFIVATYCIHCYIRLSQNLVSPQTQGN